MVKKIVALFLCFVFSLSLCSCKNKEIFLSSDSDDIVLVSSEEQKAINPLTGLEMENGLVNNRPVAVMVNNIKIAQAVQTGLNSFDIVYETHVEGGITRLMGVTKNIAAMPQIGSVRSARYPYLDLALGHDAIYVHAGYDHNYFDAHRKALGIKTADINSGAASNYGFREKNGLSSEHTLYTTGEKLNAGLTSLSFKRTTDNNTWIKFNDASAPATLGSVCTSVKVPFSNYNTSIFTYDESVGKYAKTAIGVDNKDYKTGERLLFTNVFVLTTPVAPYDDNYHINVQLSGGDGYYISNGSYEPIKWTKGEAKAAISFTKADGSEFTANAGNSWICIVDAKQSGAISLS